MTTFTVLSSFINLLISQFVSDFLNEVLQTTGILNENEVDSEQEDNFIENDAIDDINEIDVILDTVLQRMRKLEENNELMHNSVDKVIKSALHQKQNSRVRRQTDPDREPKQAKGNMREKLESVVETALRQRTHNDAQTVGTMLAQIPGILEDHGLSFDSIVSSFRSFESSIENIAKQMHEDNKQMHMDSLKIQDKLTSGLDGIKEEIHDQLEPIGLKESKLDEIVHEGLDQIAKKLGDESKLDETIHEGLHEIAEKFGDNSNLDDVVHDGLHQIAEKLGDENKLEETIHHGLETIAENMGGKSNLEDAVHDGLHGIADKLDQITTYGLDGIMDSLDKSRNPIINFPSTFGNSSK